MMRLYRVPNKKRFQGLLEDWKPTYNLLKTYIGEWQEMENNLLALGRDYYEISYDHRKLWENLLIAIDQATTDQGFAGWEFIDRPANANKLTPNLLYLNAGDLYNTTLVFGRLPRGEVFGLHILPVAYWLEFPGTNYA